MKDSANDNVARPAPDGAVYRDERFALGERDGVPYLTADGETYNLTCHPYEPCLYITDESGVMSAVHNSFDPTSVLDAFRRGGTVTSITGREYGARDFCEMAAYAAGMADVQIDEAEKVFGARPKKKPSGSDAKASRGAGANAVPTVTEHKDRSRIITDDPFFAVLADYPDSVVDFCLVANDHTGTGYDAHRRALACAANELFTEENGEVIWRFDVGKADAKQIAPDALFARTDDGALNYRRAFLAPPYPNGYTDADFTRLNAALFPNGTDALEVFEWTTDWSEYFDEGHEWWGALCVTAYDRTLDRFAVILASATD